MAAFLQAKYYRRADRKAIDWLVLHSMENNEAHDSAEAVAAYFAKTIDHPASAHVCVDNDSYVECVHPNDIAYHCGPTGNARGYGIEQAGRAMQSRAEWLDAYGESMFDIVAQILARRSVEYGIPLTFVNAAGLRAGNRGVTTHYEISQAFGESEHWDPGTGYPIDVVLAKAQSLLGEVPMPPPAQPAATVTQFPGDNMHRIDNPARKQDEHGNGYYEIPNQDAMKVISVVALGPFPPRDGYWNLPVWGRQQNGSSTIVTLSEADPNATELISVWVAD